MATQDPTLVVIDELHAHTRPSAFRDPVTGQYPPLAGADGADPDPDRAPDPDPKPDPDPDPAPEPKPEPGDWQAQARRHEREAKAARKRADARGAAPPATPAW